jgi:hypothetical protein
MVKSRLWARVPPFESWCPSVFTEHGDGARIERKMHTQSQVETEPAHGQRPQRVAVPEANRLVNP